MHRLEDDIAKILVSSDSIQERSKEMGAQISADYADRDLLLVCILKGGVIFLSDLSRAITIPHAIDFMAISSYAGGRTESSGVVRILMDLNSNIENRHVLIVEDIIDTGRTLQYITENLGYSQPGELEDLHLAEQARTPRGRDSPGLRRVQHPERVCRRIRAGLWRTLSQPAVHRRLETGIVRTRPMTRIINRGSFRPRAEFATALA